MLPAAERAHVALQGKTTEQGRHQGDVLQASSAVVQHGNAYLQQAAEVCLDALHFQSRYIHQTLGCNTAFLHHISYAVKLTSLLFLGACSQKPVRQSESAFAQLRRLLHDHLGKPSL